MHVGDLCHSGFGAVLLSVVSRFQAVAPKPRWWSAIAPAVSLELSGTCMLTESALTFLLASLETPVWSAAVCEDELWNCHAMQPLLEGRHA